MFVNDSASLTIPVIEAEVVELGNRRSPLLTEHVMPATSPRIRRLAPSRLSTTDGISIWGSATGERLASIQ